MKTNKVIILLLSIILCHSFSLSQKQEKIIETVDVLNVELSVRVESKGKLVGGLNRNDFRLYLDKKQIPIHGFAEFRKKINIKLPEAVDRSSKLSTPSRLFFLIFNISDYHKYLKENINYFFDKIIRPGDRLMVMSNKFFFNERFVLDLDHEKKRVIDVIEAEARIFKFNLISFEHDLRLLYEEFRSRRRTEDSEGGHLQLYDDMTRKYLLLLMEYRNGYLNKSGEDYIRIAEYLKGKKIEKWVINFYQIPKFYHPRFLSNNLKSGGFGGRQTAVHLKKDYLYTELIQMIMAEDNYIKDDISKYFINTGATFHTQLLSSRSHRGIQGYDYKTISVDSENVLYEISKMTRGKTLFSNKIATFIEEITEREDIYYMLTYVPTDDVDPKAKLKVMVTGPGYRVLYHNQKMSNQLRNAVNKVKEADTQVRIENAAIDNNILYFLLKGYRIETDRGFDAGKVEMRIQILDVNGKLISDKAKKSKILKTENRLRIKLGKLKRGEYYLILNIRDLVSERNDLAIIQFETNNSGISSSIEKD